MAATITMDQNRLGALRASKSFGLVKITSTGVLPAIEAGFTPDGVMVDVSAGIRIWFSTMGAGYALLTSAAVPVWAASGGPAVTTIDTLDEGTIAVATGETGASAGFVPVSGFGENGSHFIFWR